MRARSELRGRWRGWLALALLIGLAGGLVLACIAGSRRADSAYRRFLAATNASDLAMYAAPVDFNEVRHLPQVAEAATTDYVALSTDSLLGRDAAATPTTQTLVAPSASPDGGFIHLDRPKVISGRRPDPARAEEVAVNPSVAHKLGLHVGSTIAVGSYGADQLDEVLGNSGSVPRGPQLRLKVVGIEVIGGELAPRDRLGAIHLTPAFLSAYADQIAVVPGLTVKLRHGQADLPAFKAAVVGLAGGQPIEIASASHDGALAQRGIHVEAQALRLFALLAGLASLLVAYQALSRLTYSESDDYPALKAIGMARGQLWAATMIRSAGIALIASVVAVAGAVAASPALPFGRARLAEPSLGIAFDAFVLPVGAAILVVLVLLAATGPAWRAATAGPEAALPVVRVGRLGHALTRLGASPAAVTGVRMATDPGNGRRAVPVRAAVIGSACSLAALVLAFSFGASLDRLFNTPRLYGWNWDAVYGNPYGGDIADQGKALAHDKEVAGFSPVAFGEVEVDGLRTTGMAFDTVQGDVLPPVLEGRAPSQTNEIVLGKLELDSTGRKVGDMVTVVVGDRSLRMRIVGRAVLPAIGRSEVGGLGEGALLSPQGLQELAPETPSNLLAVRFATSVDHRAQLVAARDALGGASVEATAEQAPVEVADYGRVNRMPLALAGVLALIAAAMLAHALGTTVARRRRELAILKTLGFVRGQVRSTVAWQATTMIVVALAIGVPVGLVAGHNVWRLFAEGLGILPEPALPLMAVAIIIPAAVLTANVIAAVPGRTAARSHPAAVLRSQ